MATRRRGSVANKSLGRQLARVGTVTTGTYLGTGYLMLGKNARRHFNTGVKNSTVRYGRSAAKHGKAAYTRAMYKKGTTLTPHQKDLITKLRAKGTSSTFPGESKSYFAKAKQMEDAAKGVRRFSGMSRNTKIGLAVGVGTVAVGLGIYAYKRHKRTVIKRGGTPRHHRTFWARDSKGHFK